MIDAFADTEVAALAEQSIAVTYDRCGFDADALLAALDKLDLTQYVGFVYGSGFEAQPEVLARIGTRLPLIGNAPDSVKAVKAPATFFSVLQQSGIEHPKIFSRLPDGRADSCLIKFVGGSGGGHIVTADISCRPSDQYYYQKKIDGRSLSLLFLANKHDVEVIGFNEQWLSPSAASPYRYGGAVSNVELSYIVQEQFIHAARKLTNVFGLVGLNSLDALEIVDDESEAASGFQVSVLEINPRLSATFDLYSDTGDNLFARHLQACLHGQCTGQSHVAKGRQCKAHAIVYAQSDVELSAAATWPDWVVDRPLLTADNKMILAGDPVCTVLAYAGNAGIAKKIAQDRAETIQNLLQSTYHTKLRQ